MSVPLMTMSAMDQDGPHRASPEDPQPPRKRIRKGTRSCWECKHRKVRCHFVCDSDRSCRECLARGLVCRSQDYPEPENARESDRVSLNERLGRVESLLENVLERLDSVGATEALPVLPSSGVDKSPNSSAVVTPANENAPVLSLFDNEVLGAWRSGASPPNTTLYSTANRDWERIRSALLNLLPSQNTLEDLSEANTCWWLLRAQCFQDHEASLLSSSREALSRQHPAAIAKVLLWVAICLQQIPRDFDIDSLELPCAPARLIERCVNIVAQSVCSDEALISSIDGLECLVIQGIFYNNDGKLRSAWLSYRRALNAAQIIGLHRLPPITAQNSGSISRARHVWNHIIYADRYLSLMLGMYHGIADVALDSQHDQDETSSSSFMEFLCRMAGSIIERNQKFPTVNPSMVRMTQTIDSELVSIDPPVVENGDAATPSSGKCSERAQTYGKLMAQLWHFQLLAWLHLPLFLESGKQKRYDYSRQSCLEASRNMIKCYTAIRRLTTNSFCCKSLDFQAFTAAATLLINMIGPSGRSNPTPDEWEAVQSVIGSLERLAEGLPDKVATRGLDVLQTLKRVALGNSPGHSPPGGFSTADGQSGRTKVDIPYFGTIFLDCGIRDQTEAQQHQQQSKSLSAPLPPSISFHTGPVPNELQEPQMNTAMEHSTVQTQVANPAPWSAHRLELGPADIWTFDSDFATLPSFLTDLGDNWDLGL